MVEKPDPDNDSKKPDASKNGVKGRDLLWVLFVLGIAVLGLLLASIYWPNLSERTKFFTGNLLNLVIAIAVIAQVLINRKQWQAMEGQLKTAQTQATAALKAADMAQGQLVAIQHQEQFQFASLEETRRMVNQNQQMVEAMQGQLSAINKQEGHLKAQSESAQDQTRAMLDQLQASQDSVVVAVDALKLGSRGYIGIRHANIGLPESDVLTIELENIGKSPASRIRASLNITISVPRKWLGLQPNVRQFSAGGEKYDFGLTSIYPGTLTPIIDYVLTKEFSPEELLHVINKNAFLTLSLTLDYWNGYEDEFAYFVLTYKGDKTNWGIFPPEGQQK